MKTADGGATWTWQSTPVTTPGLAVPGSGGPNPFAGLFGDHVRRREHVRRGRRLPADRHRPADRHDDRRRRNVDEAHEQQRRRTTTCTAIACAPGDDDLLGRRPRRLDRLDDRPCDLDEVRRRGTTNMLNSVTCLEHVAPASPSGQNGTVDICNGTAWTATTGNGGNVFLADVACPAASTLLRRRQAGRHAATTTGGARGRSRRAAGRRSQMNGISCTSADACVAAGQPAHPPDDERRPDLARAVRAARRTR